MNNRKRTRCRKIQTIKVPETVIRKGLTGKLEVVPNPHPKAGKAIQIRH
jgi:hypothetical protein